VRLRGLARGALAVAATAAALAALLLFLASRDSSTFQGASGPGLAFPDQGHQHLAPGATGGPRFAYDSSPPTSGPHVPVLPTGDLRRLSTDELLQALEVGDVVLVYGDRRLQSGLRRLATDLAGPYSRSLAAAGQAVVLDFEPGRSGVVGVAWRHLLRSSGPSDPRLQTFIQFWLGRGANG
jgi:hypothetical protein